MKLKMVSAAALGAASTALLLLQPSLCAAQSGASGIAYDVATGAVTVVVPSGQTGAVPNAPAEVKPLAEGVQIPEDELAELRNLEATFAPYELREGDTDAAGNFVPKSILLPDERVVVVTTLDYPASAVVSISFRNPVDGLMYGCSGSIISADTVLTAGHCVFDGGWSEDVIVYPGRNGGVQPFGSCRATNLFALKAWIDALPGTDPRLHDLGAIRLDCRAGELTRWFGLRSFGAAVGDPVVVRGYPCDAPVNGKQYLSQDEIRAAVAEKAYYQNDTFGCMSGGPVYAGADEASVFAVHTNGLHNGEPWASNNAATALTDERIGLLQTWMEE